ncbi:MAG: pseudouridine synthase [Litorimonas sp.]
MQKHEKHNVPARNGAKSAPLDGQERIAKYLARAGVASRRDAEKLIEAGRIKVNGKTLDTPAFKVSAKDKILFDDKSVGAKQPARLWRYHKPKGLVTSHKDEKGRLTVFDTLPKEMGRVISVGRLDLNSEGLLLLTNDGELARKLEHPKTGFSRRYRARAYGRVTQDELDTLHDGIKIDGIQTGPIEAMLDSQNGDNCWVSVTIREGKNREVRRAMEHLGLRVNRLIRVSYGPFMLDTLEAGETQDVKLKELQTKLGHLADFPDAAPVQQLRGRPKPKAKTDKPNAAKPAPKGRGRFAKTAPKSGKYAPRTHNKPNREKSSTSKPQRPARKNTGSKNKGSNR